MYFVSTRDKDQLHPVSLSEAVIKGLANDGGLFMPQKINTLIKEELVKIPFMNLHEIASLVLSLFLGDAVKKEKLESICAEVFNFQIPLVEIEKNIYSLELFHGPTLAFKDVGARFMARILEYFSSDYKKEIKVVVATSGDTGSAVAAGFHGVNGIQVYILYPKGKVSRMQQKQLTTWGENITALELQGTFDDCQYHVKKLLSDPELRLTSLFTSANSINIARLLPQVVYYVYAWSRVQHHGKPIIMSVPSGNFGNLTAGILAQKIGVPIFHFIAATNKNDIVPVYLREGNFLPRPSVQTISNAMDVGNPSNFERLLQLFDNAYPALRKAISGYSYSDEETQKAMINIFESYAYVSDPHGAIGFLGLKQYISEHPGEFSGVFLETAHPAKFHETVEKCLDITISIPEKLKAFEEKEGHAVACLNDYETVKKLILNGVSNAKQ
ncbi:MAG: threonine synthase [Bacteroidetes bacterium HGW-Bacteroidetes-1]|jgi:threonine synthase|nr:MAG: threonine synthase [Bacteroidetes bacterium HGW-Bacteroidetes-1]